MTAATATINHMLQNDMQAERAVSNRPMARCAGTVAAQSGAAVRR
jgi:hypothetical protein